MNDVITTCKMCNMPCVKFGFNYVKIGKKQCYYCRKCNLKFINPIELKKIRYKLEIISMSIQWWFDGFSLRIIRKNLKIYYGINPNQSTILRWIVNNSQRINNYINNNLILNNSNINFTDETVIKCKGKNFWLWGILDNKSRYLIGYHYTKFRTTREGMKMFRDYKNKIDKPAINLISDGLHQYSKIASKGALNEFPSRVVPLLMAI